jgi:hypothetical protein
MCERCEREDMSARATGHIAWRKGTKGGQQGQDDPPPSSRYSYDTATFRLLDA